jgi:hypothetical protein
MQFWSCMKCEASYLVHNSILVHFDLSVLQGAVMGSLQCPVSGCNCSLFAIHKIWDTVNSQELPQLEFWNCLKCAKRLVKDGETLVDVEVWLNRI